VNRRLAAVVLALSAAFAISFVTAAWASTQVYYLGPGNYEFYPYEDQPGPFTGKGWTRNFMHWYDNNGGSPEMCSRYLNSSYVPIKPDVCSPSGVEDDYRIVSSYSAPDCGSSGSNHVNIDVTDCWAVHN
jgi:hypothetical protein